MARKKFYESLYLQVIMGILIGALLGHFYPEAGAAMKPLGDGFIKLIKMTIAPIIFCAEETGVAGMENMKSVGKTGGLAILYFEVVSALALVLGLVIVNVVRPGRWDERQSRDLGSEGADEPDWQRRRHGRGGEVAPGA